MKLSFKDDLEFLQRDGCNVDQIRVVGGVFRFTSLRGNLAVANNIRDDLKWNHTEPNIETWSPDRAKPLDPYEEGLVWRRASQIFRHHHFLLLWL